MGRRGVPTIGWAQFAELTGVDGSELVNMALNGTWLESDARRQALVSDNGSRTSFRWVKALDIVQWHHYGGETITACGRRLKVSRQRAKQLLDLLTEAHPFDAPDREGAQAEARARVLARIFSDAVDIVRLEPGILLGDLAARVSCSTTDLVNVLGDLAAFTFNPAWSARRGRSRWSDERVVGVLRGMHVLNGGRPLTKRIYGELAATAGVDVPSHALLVKRYGSWSQALKVAGLPTVKTRLDYSWANTKDDALADMVRFVLETGRTSAGEYRRWAEANPEALRVPQAILGEGQTWTDSIGQVFDQFRDGSLRTKYQELIDHMADRRAEELSTQYGAPFELRKRVLVPSATAPLPGEDGTDPDSGPKRKTAGDASQLGGTKAKREAP